jgi:uncharacterized protein YycO
MTAPDGLLPGDFFVTKMNGDVGLLISIGEYLNGDGFTQWDHAGIYVGDGHIVEAQPGGAILSPADRYAGHSETLWSTGRITPSQEQRTAIAAAARGYVGVGYSEAEYWALAAHRLHVPTPGLHEYITHTHRMICSQLVAQSWKDGGFDLFPGEWPGYITPARLGDRIKETI